MLELCKRIVILSWHQVTHIADANNHRTYFVTMLDLLFYEGVLEKAAENGRLYLHQLNGYQIKLHDRCSCSNFDSS